MPPQAVHSSGTQSEAAVVAAPVAGYVLPGGGDPQITLWAASLVQRPVTVSAVAPQTGSE
jgi:hypothetical protein